MKYSRQPKLEVTASPGLNSLVRDSMTSPTAPPCSGLPISKGGTYDFPLFMRPRMYGSTDRKRLRTSTCPSWGGASSICAKVKSVAVGIPRGREAKRTSRLAVFGIKQCVLNSKIPHAQPPSESPGALDHAPLQPCLRQPVFLYRFALPRPHPRWEPRALCARLSQPPGPSVRIRAPIQ